MANSTAPPDCPFCRCNNLLKANVIAETDEAYMIDNIRFPGNYLIIPSRHAESPLELSDSWWKEVKALLPKTPNSTESYNLSFNYGSVAGQTVRHMHLWVVPRAAGRSDSGKGLVTLLGQQPQS